MAFLATVGWVWACDLLGLNKEPISIEITIEDDTDFDTVVDQLEEAGLIQYKFLFKLYAQFSHAQDKIAPGKYELSTEMDYHALVSNMSSSSATRMTTDVTIPEGYTIDQLFDLLDERGVTSTGSGASPWGTITGWRVTCSPTRTPLRWEKILSTSSTRCW